METVSIKLDDGTGRDFDKILEENRAAKLPQYGGELVIATKEKATASGKAAVAIAFFVYIDGKPQRVQAVTTEANFLNAAAAVEGAKRRREESPAELFQTDYDIDDLGDILANLQAGPPPAHMSHFNIHIGAADEFPPDLSYTIQRIKTLAERYGFTGNTFASPSRHATTMQFTRR
jgi:hypothetical protein